MAAESWDLPRLERLVTIPVFAPDASLIAVPGYSYEGAMLYAPSTPVPAVPASPTEHELEAACAVVTKEALAEVVAEHGERWRSREAEIARIGAGDGL